MADIARLENLKGPTPVFMSKGIPLEVRLPFETETILKEIADGRNLSLEELVVSVLNDFAAFKKRKREAKLVRRAQHSPHNSFMIGACSEEGSPRDRL